MEVDIWYATYPDLNFKLCARVPPESCPGMGLEVKMFNRPDLHLTTSCRNYDSGSAFKFRELRFSLMVKDKIRHL